LARGHVEDAIEGEGPLGLIRIDFAYIFAIEFNDRLATAGNFDFVLRSKSCYDLDRVVTPSDER